MDTSKSHIATNFRKLPARQRKIIAAALITIGLLAFTFFNGSSQSLGNLRVSFINVGQGDSALLRDPGGFDVLIDGGIASQGETVVQYLRANGVDDVDVLVASHADADHIGGLLPVLQMNDIPVEAVVYNGYPGDTATWNNFMAAVAAEGLVPTAAQFPQTFTWGAMTAHVLNPGSGLGDPETNAASLVLRIDYGDFNVLFTGDIDTAVEAEIIARGTPLAAEVLKVAHHGSAYGSSDGFLAAADPAESVISVGGNSYGHPDPDTVGRILASGSNVWRTDQDGNIVVVSDGFSYSVSVELAQYLLHLPLVMLEPALPTPTATATTAVPTDVPTVGDVQINAIFYDGVQGSAEPDEYVVIQNLGSQPVQVQGWKLRDNSNHVYTFPYFVMQPGQTCRVYTNQSHPETCGFNYGSTSAIWNNGGDCAYLRDAGGKEVDQYCYP